MRIGTNELLIILVVALLIFGPKNLPKLGKMFGKTINGFKKGMEERRIPTIPRRRLRRRLRRRPLRRTKTRSNCGYEHEAQKEKSRSHGR